MCSTLFLKDQTHNRTMCKRTNRFSQKKTPIALQHMKRYSIVPLASAVLTSQIGKDWQSLLLHCVGRGVEEAALLCVC